MTDTPPHTHDYQYVGSESSYGSTTYDLDVAVCRTCGVVQRSKKRPAIGA